MAKEAIKGTLSRSELKPSSIDVIVIATESLWDVGTVRSGSHELVDFRAYLLRTLVLELGLTNAHVVIAWSGGCGNLLPALSTARAQVASGGARNVLLLATDRLRPGQSRVLPSGNAVLGDVAVACIVSERDEDFCIDQVVMRPSSGILSSRAEENFILHARFLTAALRDADDRLRQRAGMKFADADCLVTESFHSSVIGLLRDRLSVASDKVLHPARSRFGHAFSADLLLSLGLLVEQGKLKSYSVLAIFSISSWVVGGAILRTSHRRS